MPATTPRIVPAINPTNTREILIMTSRKKLPSVNHLANATATREGGGKRRGFTIDEREITSQIPRKSDIENTDSRKS